MAGKGRIPRFGALHTCATITEEIYNDLDRIACVLQNTRDKAVEFAWMAMLDRARDLERVSNTLYRLRRREDEREDWLRQQLDELDPNGGA